MADNHPGAAPSIVKIDCPDCGPGQPARVLVREKSGLPETVSCLGCQQFLRAEDVGWREK